MIPASTVCGLKDCFMHITLKELLTHYVIIIYSHLLYDCWALN